MSLLPLTDELLSTPVPFQTKYFKTTLDHLNSTKNETFTQRYLLNDDYFGSPLTEESCPGPILLYTGNEGPITGFWESNGFMHYLAKKYGGLLLFIEERYYGESQPSEECCPYLSTEQIIGDFVQILTSVKRDYSAESCPTIAFGGSYGGTLAAYMKYSFPDVVQGALSASSELGYYDLNGWEERNITKYTFSNVVGTEYNKTDGCLEAIWDAGDAIENAEVDELLQTFNYCELSALKPQKSALFTYGLEGLPQSNYPYPVGSLPAWPVSFVCELMTNVSIPLLSRAARVTALSMRYELDGPCFPTPEEGPGNVPGDGPGKGSWGYQSCTETLHTFSSIGRNGGGIRNFDFDVEIENLVNLCANLYGVSPSSNALVERYAGFDIARQTSNTIFSSGELDPWGGAALTARDGGDDATDRGVYFFRMKNGAHHLDLRGWNKDDPIDVTMVRKKEEEIIVGWINEWIDKNAKTS